MASGGLKKRFEKLLEALPGEQLAFAKDYARPGEPGLAIEQIVNALYEHDLPIDQATRRISSLCRLMDSCGSVAVRL